MRPRPGSTGFSLVTAEELGHDVFVRSRAGAPGGDPFVVGREGGLDLRFFQGFGRGVPFHCPEPPEFRKRDDRGGLPAEVDHLVRFGWFRAGSRLETHTANGTGQRPGGPGGATVQKRMGSIGHGSFGIDGISSVPECRRRSLLWVR
jgi:hypothetical protein